MRLEMLNFKFAIPLIFTLICSYAVAETISEETILITEYAIIAPRNNPSGITVLLSIPISDSLATATITYAEVVFNVQPVGNSDSTIEILSIPIAVQWDPANVEWDSDWEESGGNLIDNLRSFHGIRITDNGISNIDITDAVLRWQDESFDNNYGLAIKVPLDSDVRFRIRPINPHLEHVALCRILYRE